MRPPPRHGIRHLARLHARRASLYDPPGGDRNRSQASGAIHSLNKASRTTERAHKAGFRHAAVRRSWSLAMMQKQQLRLRNLPIIGRGQKSAAKVQISALLRRCSRKKCRVESCKISYLHLMIGQLKVKVQMPNQEGFRAESQTEEFQAQSPVVPAFLPFPFFLQNYTQPRHRRRTAPGRTGPGHDYPGPGRYSQSPPGLDRLRPGPGGGPALARPKPYFQQLRLFGMLPRLGEHL